MEVVVVALPRSLISEIVKQTRLSNSAVDVHQLARTIQRDFPEVKGREIEKVIEHEVISNRASAFWDGEPF
jgi:hypothetical protein